MRRRDLLRGGTALTLGILSGAQQTGAVPAEIDVRPKEAGPTISKHIYGHFIEHLGGVIYDGIWVGHDSKVPNVAGIRRQIIDDMKRIAAECRGVGEIGAYVYDIEGNPCAHEYANRVIGLTLAELRGIPFRIGVAATELKCLPIYGALRGGYLHVLITDEAAARGVLGLFERDFRKSP